MNIGVDMDGVLLDEDRYILDNLSKYLYTHNMPPMAYPTVYESKPKANLSDEQNENYLKEYFYEYLKNAKISSYAKEVLDILKQRGHKIIIITGRSKQRQFLDYNTNSAELTEEWLRKNGIYYDKLIFANLPKTKEVKENKIDLMLEDYDKTICELVKITDVFCFNNLYNTNLQFDNMIRVYSWYDFLSKFDKRYNEK